MYDEELVKEIMISTALCVQELLMDDPQAAQDDIFDFIETSSTSSPRPCAPRMNGSWPNGGRIPCPATLPSPKTSDFEVPGPSRCL
jgi:hypothetical protein